ncbi:MAG TPA: putative lipid II flippase FtsW [Gammaproteobacteria bacterium]|nr:putative lipid II flippase FtsW [Gammaproteobacteria bacterium]
MADKSQAWLKWRFDPTLMTAVSCLLMLGLVMVTSASMVVAEKRMGSAFYYAFHHAAYLSLGLLIAVFASQMGVRFWQKISGILLIVTLIMLALVLMPIIGKKVNGSSRWLNLGLLTLQVSELAKIFIIIYMASYVARHEEAVKTHWIGFLKPLSLLILVGGFLLLEPDFGAMVVIMSTGLGMLFLAGVPFRYFFVLVALMVVSFGGLMVSAPYRLKRLTAFLDPWAYQYDSGYQLTQALIAFGRGEWIGVGLGSSVQKLFYLPEAYTDFVFAVLAEELGLIGALSVVILFVIFIYRGITIGLLAERRGDRFAGFLVYGLTFWIGLQALINMGVNTGLLPTKGLTLPFLSYGGSSLLAICFALGLIFKIDRDNRIYFRREAGFVV